MNRFLNKILQGDALTMRSKDGRFVKGQHWRARKPFWDKEWLENEYAIKKRSCSEIAKDFGVGDTAIQFWLKKHGIKGRDVSECREIKKWGSPGDSNPMYGRTGKENPNWNGGNSPERQTLYARSVWKELAKKILKRDGYKCTECGAVHTGKSKLTVHHIKPWAKYPELRFDEGNLTTLCQTCHKQKHARR